MKIKGTSKQSIFIQECTDDIVCGYKSQDKRPLLASLNSPIMEASQILISWEFSANYSRKIIKNQVTFIDIAQDCYNLEVQNS